MDKEAVERTHLFIVDRPGPEDYAATLSLQTNLLEAKVKDGTLPDALVLVEHEHIYTVGRGNPVPPPREVRGATVRTVEVGRGGKTTYHGPGQLVAYPIFDLNRHGKDVHVFLRKLEDVIIRTLKKFAIQAARREGLTGVWVKDAFQGSGSELEWKKIASIGIGVRKWISYHGISINVSPDLRFFEEISPCGALGSSITSMEEVLGSAPRIEAVKEVLYEEFCNVFALSVDEQNDSLMRTAKLKSRARPSWLKVKAPGSPAFQETLSIVRDLKLVTVCEEARCPNMGECWTHKTATFMIMGDLCTRRCSFCSVKDGALDSLSPLDPLEPIRVAQAVKKLGLRHVVITSVNRDDLTDMGALHFHQTVSAIKHVMPECDVEFLIPDMRGRRQLVETILQSGLVKVLNHNVETVPRLYRTVRPGAIFQRSLDILGWARELHPNMQTKSGIMVGLGEKKEEVFEVLDSLRAAGVSIVTIGQYLQPTAKQLPIYRYVTPEEFEEYRVEGYRRGFAHVESGPLVRSSYHAWQHTGDLESPLLTA